jgi:hypothetical protein
VKEPDNLQIAADTIPRQRPGYTVEKSPCCFFLKDTESKKLIKLNETSALIWQVCTGEWSVGEIIDVLKESYPDAADGMDADVHQALNLLMAQDVLEIQ